MSIWRMTLSGEAVAELYNAGCRVVLVEFECDIDVLDYKITEVEAIAGIVVEKIEQV